MTPSDPSGATPPSPLTPDRHGQVRELLTQEPEARIGRLTESAGGAALLPLLPAQEFYYTVKAATGETRLELLKAASTEQIGFLLDLELWKKDRLRTPRVRPWLELLAACGPLALERWLTELELGDWTLLLGTLVEVHLTEEDRDPMQDLPGDAPLTLDGVYYVHARKDVADLVRQLLVPLREADPDRYYRLLEAIKRDTGSELEEYCWQERQRRLAECGFPEWEEAMQIYARLDCATPGELPAARDEHPGSTEAGLPLQWLDGPGTTLLQRALDRVSGAADLATLATQLGYLANKVAVADGLDLDRVESFRSATEKAAGYLNVGLQALCGDDATAASKLLERHWLEHLFRAGWTRIRAVRTAARRLFDRGWPQGHKERLLFLDPPLPETLEGLLRSHPLWYDRDRDTPGYRCFADLGEVEAAHDRIARADFLGRFLPGVVDIRLDDLREALVRLETDNLKGSTVFLTALLNAALNRGFRFHPLQREDVPPALARVWASQKRPRHVRRELLDTCVEWSRSVTAITAREAAFLDRFVGDCFALLEEQFGHLAPEEIPDPRFTRGVWIE